MSNANTAKKIQYEGKNPKLVNGRYYTIKALAEITGLTDNVIRYRLNGSNICTDADLIKNNSGRKLRKHKVDVVTTLSQKWLTRKLV